MRTRIAWLVLLVASFTASGPLAYAEHRKPADKNASSAPDAATKEEVEQLRREVAELKATILKLVAAKQQAPGGARLVSAVAVPPAATSETAEAAPSPEQPVAAESEIADAAPLQAKDQKKTDAAAFQAGWNGEHFFVKSADGKFQIQPQGYTQLDYRAYRSDPGTPPNSFAIRRGRFGFLGNYGKHFEFNLLADFADTGSTLVRDFYVNIKYRPELEFQFGQFKEPFSQEELTPAWAIDFVERSLAVTLFPSPTSFRSPGVMVHGALFGGMIQYWGGAFNGKGTLKDNTTSEPETVERLQIFPFKKTSFEPLKGLGLGGAFALGHTRGLSNEQSFSGLVPDRAFSIVPTVPISGKTQRYTGDVVWTYGPLAFHGEYDQLNEFRDGLGTGGTNLPGVIGKAWNGQVTYMLTGEKHPDGKAPKPNRAFLTEGGRQGIGAWEVKFRYSGLQVIGLGGVPAAGLLPIGNRVTEFVPGLNWYPNHWVRYMLDFDIDRVKGGTVGGVEGPRRFLVVLQRMQFRF